MNEKQPEKKISYYEDRSIKNESWWVNGRLHREDGPAWTWYREDRSVRYEAWWIDGINLIKEEYLAWHRNKIIEKYLAD